MACGQAASTRTRAVTCQKGGVVGSDTECAADGSKPAASSACSKTNGCGILSSRQQRWPPTKASPKKVTWAYYYLAQAHVSAAQILAQKINYIVVSFAQIEGNGAVAFPGGGCTSPGDAARYVSKHGFTKPGGGGGRMKHDLFTEALKLNYGNLSQWRTRE